MAFNLNKWSRQSVALNTGNVNGIGGPAIFSYRSTDDLVAAIAAANYFSDEVENLSVDDLIFVVDSASVVKSYRVATSVLSTRAVTVVVNTL